MKKIEKYSLIAAIAIAAVIAVISGLIYQAQTRPYAVIKDYVATHGSELKLSEPQKTTTRCVKNVDCHALTYKLDEENCNKASQAYLGAYCGTTKSVEFEGHSLVVSIGRNADGNGHKLEVSLAK